MSKNKIKKNHKGTYLCWIATITLVFSIISSVFLTLIFCVKNLHISQGQQDALVLTGAVGALLFIIMEIWFTVACKKFAKRNETVKSLKVFSTLSIIFTVLAILVFIVCIGLIIVAIFSWLLVFGFFHNIGWWLLNKGISLIPYTIYVFWPCVAMYAVITPIVWIKCRNISLNEAQ